jgi:hypothetical protein
MIGHQAVRVAYPPESLDSNTKYFEEPSPINIVEKDIFPCVSPTGDVIYSSFVFNPQWTSHKGKYSTWNPKNKDPTPFEHHYRAVPRSLGV